MTGFRTEWADAGEHRKMRVTLRLMNPKIYAGRLQKKNTISGAVTNEVEHYRRTARDILKLFYINSISPDQLEEVLNE